ncbi:hypothetical protein [Brevundimonas sp. DC300-4]|uniref:hypothetical protein n=1 Tax=Brevundimonas sp. DC300-4 TaxID=2804594 RepID=UPI003CEA2DBE
MATGALAPDDESLVRAARRIVRQFDVSAAEQGAPIRVTEVRSPPASDPASTRLAIDGLVTQVGHLNNLFAVRESTYEAVVERLERLVVTIEGRVDALTSDLDEFRRGNSLTRLAEADELDRLKSSLAAELSPILELCRAMIFDAQATQGLVVADIQQAVSALSASRDERSTPTS